MAPLIAFFLIFVWSHVSSAYTVNRFMGERTLVQLRRGADVQAHKRFLEAHQLESKIVYWYDLGEEFQGYALEEPYAYFGDPESHSLIRRRRDVELMEQDAIATIDACQTGAAWHLARISQPKFPLPRPNIYTYSYGPFENVTAYIIDTTIDTTHPDFEGRARIGASFASGANGHGTHVAGLIGSRTYGVMKEAQLVGVSVLDGSGTGLYSTMAAGLTWALQHYHRSKTTAVINMSVGGPQSDFMNNAVNAVVSAGLPVVVAAGNNGKDACATSPASASLAITVGSIGQTNNVLSAFSNRGNCVTLLAPGEQILSTWLNGYTAWLDGTSMATPIVSGIVLTYLSWLPRLSPGSCKHKLINDAFKGLATGVPNDGTPNLIVSNGFSDDSSCPSYVHFGRYQHHHRDFASGAGGNTDETGAEAQGAFLGLDIPRG